MKKLLAAPDPSRALLWMRQAGVLSRVLPESEKWGIDSIHPLVKAEQDLGWAPDPVLRLEALVPQDAARMKAMAERLKMSGAEADRLQRWALCPAIDPATPATALARLLYRNDPAPIVDRLRLSLAAARGRALAGAKEEDANCAPAPFTMPTSTCTMSPSSLAWAASSSLALADSSALAAFAWVSLSICVTAAFS